jgi:hypothetical protein
MKEVGISIAGINYKFVPLNIAAEYLFDELPGLLPGFITGNTNKNEEVCLVHFDHKQKYSLKFHSEPHLIDNYRSLSNETLFNLMRDTHFSSVNENPNLIGFLNGYLSFDESSNRGLICIFCSDGANHFVATLLKLLFVFVCLVLASKSRLMFHGAGIKKRDGGGGYLFLGKSGTGKSTVAALSSHDVVLSDDATVVQIAKDECSIHATPFRQIGIERSSSQGLFLEKEKLDKLIFLHQAEANFIKPREQQFAFMEILIKHLHCFEVMGESLKREAFHLCRAVCEMTPSFDLYFRKDPSFWELVIKK